MKSPNRTLLWPIFIARRIAAAIRPTKAVGIGGLKVKKTMDRLHAGVFDG